MHKIRATNYQPRQFDTNLFTKKKVVFPLREKNMFQYSTLSLCTMLTEDKDAMWATKEASSTMKMQSYAQNTQLKFSFKITLILHCGWLYWTQVRSLSLAERSFHIEHFEHWLGLSVSLSFVETWLATAVKATKDVNWIHAQTLSTADKSRKSCQQLVKSCHSCLSTQCLGSLCPWQCSIWSVAVSPEEAVIGFLLGLFPSRHWNQSH